MANCTTNSNIWLQRLERGCIVATVLILLQTTRVANAMEVSLRAGAACGASVVRLEHIATIKSPNRDDAAAFGAIELFPAPAAGETRLVRASEVRELLTLRGIDLNRCHVTGSPWVKVTATKHVDLVPTPAEKAKGLATATGTPPKAAPAAYQAHAPSLSPTKPTSAPTSPVEAKGESNERQRLVAVRDLKRGDIVAASDVRLQPVGATKWNVDWLESAEQAIGKEVARSIPAQAALEQRQLISPVLVRKGETIDVLVRGGGVVVRTSAVAQSDGSKGETIGVQSPFDKKQHFLVRVMSWKQAEVVPLSNEVSVVPSTR